MLSFVLKETATTFLEKQNIPQARQTFEVILKITKLMFEASQYRGLCNTGVQYWEWGSQVWDMTQDKLIWLSGLVPSHLASWQLVSDPAQEVAFWTQTVWGLKSWFCHCVTVSLWGVIYFLCASVSSLIKWGITKYLCLVIIHGACAKSLQSCATLWYAMDCSLPVSSVHGDSPGKTTGVGCCALLQGIFPAQGWNPLLLCQTCTGHLGSPYNLLLCNKLPNEWFGLKQQPLHSLSQILWVINSGKALLASVSSGSLPGL